MCYDLVVLFSMIIEIGVNGLTLLNTIIYEDNL